MVDDLVNTWPQSNITGIEIDPVMIKLGKKYFHIHQIPQLSIINTDAFEWLNHNHQKYDLILIDLFVKGEFPQKAQSTQFFHTIKSTLTPQGTAVFNRLVLTGQKHQAKQFKRHLEQTFTQVHKIPTPSNWLLQVT